MKFELGFVESMRRRWDVLGIDVNGKGKAKAKENAEEGMDEREVDQMQTEADGEGDEAEQTRKEIMQGAIVKSVISNSVKGVHKCRFSCIGCAKCAVYRQPYRKLPCSCHYMNFCPRIQLPWHFARPSLTTSMHFCNKRSPQTQSPSGSLRPVN